MLTSGQDAGDRQLAIMGTSKAERGGARRRLSWERPLTIELQLEPAALVVGGSVDFSSVDRLRVALGAASAEAGDLEIDVTDLDFIDAAGLGAFADADARLGSGGGRLRLVGAGTGLLRLLEVTGLDHLRADHE